MSVKNKILYLLLLTLQWGFSQVDDARLWLKGTVEKKITQRTSILGEASTRIGENMSRVQTAYVELSGDYSPYKWLGFTLGYRYSARRSYEPSFTYRNRVFLDIGLKKKFFKRIVLQPRVRFQKQYTAIQTSETGHIPTNFVRFKLQVGLDLDRKYEPYISSEVYYQSRFDEKEFNRVRYEAGVNYKLNKHHRVTLFFLHQRAFNEPDPLRQYITGLSYKYTF